MNALGDSWIKLNRATQGGTASKLSVVRLPVRFVVLDEADEMLKKDFYEQIKPSAQERMLLNGGSLLAEWLFHRVERGSSSTR